MKLKGKITIEFWNTSISAKTRDNLVVENLIFNETYKKIVDGNFQIFTNNTIGVQTNIALLGNTEPVAAGEFEDISIVWDVIKYGVRVEPSPIWFENVMPYFGLITNRVDADNIAYTFDSVGLIIGTDVNSRLSRVLLSIPCTVDPFTVLRIFYEIALDITDAEILLLPYTERFFRDYGKSLFGVNSLSLSPCFFPFFAPKNTQDGTETVVTGYQKYLAFWFLSGYQVLDNFSSNRFAYATDRNKYKYFGTAFSNILQSGIPGTQDEDIGVIFNSIFVGNSPSNSTQPNFIPSPLKSNVQETAYYTQSYAPSERNIDGSTMLFNIPFQSSWLHKSNSTVPYFSESTFGESTGIYELQIKSPATKISNPFPIFLKIEVISSGTNATATYRFSICAHLGTVDNTYNLRRFLSPFLCNTTQPFDKCHGWEPEFSHNRIYIGGSSILMWDDSGVSAINLMTGIYRNFDATTTPALTATNIKQCCWNTSNLIYIGCRSTGMWTINQTTWAVAQVVSGNCYGVSTGFNNVVYAATGTGIRNSTDNFATANTSILASAVDGNFANIQYIHARKQSTGLAIIYQNTSNVLDLVWCDLVTTPSVVVTNIANYTASNRFNTVGNANNDFWVIGSFKCDWNTTSLTSVSNQLQGVVEFYENYYIGNSAFVDKDLNAIPKAQLNQSGVANSLIHLVDGICLFEGVEVLQVKNGSSIFWDTYNWNGSSWVRGNTTAKTMHATYQDLIYDIQIKFNTSTPLAYLATEYYVQSVNYGILKDNATTLDFKYAFYSIDTKAATQTGTIAATITLANSALPGFVSIDSDGIIATINGVPVSTIYIAGEVPLANEISVDLTTGVVTFFAGDIGKAYSIEYISIGFFL